jgi:hypothetical protein
MHPLRGAPSHSLSHRAGGNTRRARGPDPGVFAEWLALSSVAICLESLRTHWRDRTGTNDCDQAAAASGIRYEPHISEAKRPYRACQMQK